MYAVLYTKTKGTETQLRGTCRQISLKVHTNNLKYSAIANTLVITVPGDNALKRVSIILLRLAKRLVLQIYQSLEERRHNEMNRKV